MRECGEIDWSGWETLDDDGRSRLGHQLRKEVGVAHLLYNVADTLRVMAKDRASDDILACDPANSHSAYVVHLVFSDGPDIDANFPWTCSIPKTLVPDRFLMPESRKS